MAIESKQTEQGGWRHVAFYFILFAVLFMLLVWILLSTSVDSKPDWIDFISKAVGIATGLAAILGIVVAAPRLVKAAEKQADEAEKTTRIAKDIRKHIRSPGDAEFEGVDPEDSELDADKLNDEWSPPNLSDEDLSAVVSSLLAYVDVYRSRNPEFSGGVDKEEFSKFRRNRFFGDSRYRRYRAFMHGLVAIFNLVYDAAKDGSSDAWKLRIGEIIDTHNSATSRWRGELSLGKFDQ